MRQDFTIRKSTRCLIAWIIGLGCVTSCTKPQPVEPVMPPEPKEYQLPTETPPTRFDESGGPIPTSNENPSPPSTEDLIDVPEAPPIMEEASKDDKKKQKSNTSKKTKPKKKNTKKPVK